MSNLCCLPGRAGGSPGYARPPIRAPTINPPAIPGPQPQPPRASTGVGTETAVMAITAAAEKTTAAFFMGFPFTKIKRQAKAFCRLNPATLCPLLVPSRGTQQENREPEICSGQIRNSELYVRIRKKDLAPIAQEAGD